MKITGIILAGGKSTRMGKDKALIEVDGVSLLDRSLNALEPVCDNILISSGNKAHKRFGIGLIEDEVPDCGPLGGVYSCLKKSTTDWNFVVSVDSPFVSPEFIRYLFSNLGNCDAIVPAHKNGKEPLIAFYHRNAFSQLEDNLHQGKYKMHCLLDAIRTKYINVEDWAKNDPNLFFNYNRPEDL